MSGRVDLRSRLLRARTSDEGHRVTTYELFFDLVFVFAFTQVTHHMAHEHSAVGVLQALVILGVLWWSWTSYSWLANQTFVDEGLVRLGMAVAMASMFVVALVIPEAFHDLEGGLSGPLVFVAAYAVVRITHVALYLIAAGEDGGLRRQVIVNIVPLVIGVGLLLLGVLVGGEAQLPIWAAAMVLDLGVTYILSRNGNWRVHSAAHWSERYGLVVILALGESIVAIGVGASELPISVPLLVGSLLAVALSLLLWWLYFDVLSIAAEHELARRKGAARATLAVEAYTYVHMFLIAGVVISALGVEEVMAHVDDPEPLGLFGSVALLGGTSLYLAAHALFWRRTGGSWKWWRLAAATALLALIPLVALVHPLAALAVAVLVTAVPVAVETVRYREHRAGVRAGLHRSAADAD
ncbi:low temperature requirement protein LtrA [Diaminobutyricimonas aerilata]|uniref:Low temperature requirement protein LtrA n=1 Tax=Diaminobutyricimonas aerilata TaxID=1162967 RepID=A0A2M9CGW2_9MICO|nr:low temperature requirement protein A [Diaminobutyricimonas aerilata]PJJ71154.1 low temperature requirement protein LtrA [Diaminobutyricimonas aerilata]